MAGRRRFQLEANQHERLQARLKEEGFGQHPVSIPPHDRTFPAPLSEAQERLWFLDQLTPSSAYNIPLALWLRGTLDLTALEEGLTALLGRHESLRTTFEVRDERHVQKVRSATRFALSTEDLSGLCAADREVETRRRMHDEARQQMKLATGPLFRARLLRVCADEHLLLATVHHSIADGWSLGILVRDLAELYSATVEHRPARLPPLALQFVDYAAWMQTRAPEHASIEYWKQRLGGELPILKLPSDRPRPRVQSFRGATAPIALDRQSTDALRALARDEQATLFMVLLAGFLVVLSRRSRQADLVIGTAVANRPRVELEPLIGFFVNSVPLRNDLSGDPSFRELVQRVRHSALGAFEHQEVSFETLVELLRPERDLGHNPIFQAMFVLQNAPVPTFKLPGLTVDIEEPSRGTSKFDLTLSLDEADDGLSGWLEYASDLFDACTAADMADEIVRVLRAAATRPQTPIGALPLLATDERARVLALGAGPSLAISQRLVQDAFEAQAQRTPEALAVSFEGRTLSYAALDRRANQLAALLRTRGVGPEVFVGIFLERSVDQAVALLATLKAGGAYVPLDPSYPEERLRWMVEDSAAPVIITQRSLALRCPGDERSQVLLDDEPSWTAASGAWVPNGASPDSPVYVTYTSGSTGRPKGVILPHRALTNLLSAYGQSLPRSTRVAQFASLSFDVSFAEIFFALSFGGSIHVVAEPARYDVAKLAAWVAREQIQTFWFPVPVLQQLAEHALTGTAVSSHPANPLGSGFSGRLELSSLTDIVATGEALQITTPLRALMATLSSARLHNHYGPSETHLTTTLTLSPSPDEWPMYPPIGRAISNSRAYLLDERLEPVPPGVAGELYFGGLALARGYLHRPELTARGFVPDPFSPEPGARMYRTGDFARSGRDGVLEFLGRLDDQVKIRGQRVELGEIESAIGAHPAVAEVVVIARDDGKGKQLCAYVVLQDELDVNALRRHVRERLPAFMMPSSFCVLSKLPLSPNGKVDRSALRNAEPPSAPESDRIAPRGPAEASVAEVWAQVLGGPLPGVHSDFFESGGHSLIAAKLATRLSKTFGVEVSVRQVFETPTVEGLASALERLRRDSGTGFSSLPTSAVEVGDFAPSFAQERLWVLQQIEGASASLHLPTATLLRGHLDADALEQSLLALLARHPALRTTFFAYDGKLKQRVLPVDGFDLSRIDLSSIPTSERDAAFQKSATAFAAQPFDLERGPLLRALYVRLAPDEHGLVVVAHHLVCDGWSIEILLRELGDEYSAACAGPSASKKRREALAVRYSDFSEWQRTPAHLERIEQDLEFWRKALAGAPERLELLHDGTHPVPRRAARHRTVVPRPVLEKLSSLLRSEGASLFMGVLASYWAILSRWTHQRDIIIGTDVTGRTRQELEGVVGFFVNQLSLRISAPSSATFRDLIRRAREVVLDAHSHQEVPFERVVAALNPLRSLDRSPLYQAKLALQPYGSGLPELQGLSARLVDLPPQELELDLVLSAEERPSGLALDWTYREDCFRPETIERLAAHFEAFLEAALAQPDARSDHLRTLAAADRHQLIDVFNRTQVDYGSFRPIHVLIDEMAQRSPATAAVTFRQESWTYERLQQSANQLAHALREHGVRAEDRVIVYAERSIELVVAVLGSLASGGTYVPIDTSYPASRVQYVLDDSRPRVILTQSHLLPRIPPGNYRTLCLDSDRQIFSKQPDSSPGVQVHPAQAAYVIYTSGSTGKPKGVINSHEAVWNLHRWMARTYPLTAKDSVLQKTPVGFDVSVWEFLWPLMMGARLVVAEPDLHGDPSYLADLITSEQVSALQFVPSMLRAFLTALPPERLRSLSSLQHCIAIGEALPGDVVGSFHKQLSARLTNLYGPTEAAMQVTAFECERGEHYVNVPIGKPIANVQMYVLDHALEPCPIGVAGELFIGGVALARGYHGKPEATAEKFIPDPFSSRPGQRLYRTGDLARLRPDGDIAFLGRLDHQVKIRGFRIELEEIEVCLAELAEIAAAVVVAREDSPGEQRLVAYVVFRAEPLSPTELRQKLLTSLPEYMVPQVFVTLSALPLSANGKLDRKLLPAPAAPLKRAREEPATPMERLLAQLWEAVLHVPPDRRDNFFEIGGDSILAIQIAARANESGVQLRPRDLFEHPTLEALAAHADTRPSSAVGGETITERTRTAPIAEHVKEVGVSQSELDLAAAELAGHSDDD